MIRAIRIALANWIMPKTEGVLPPPADRARYRINFGPTMGDKQ